MDWLRSRYTVAILFMCTATVLIVLTLTHGHHVMNVVKESAICRTDNSNKQSQPESQPVKMVYVKPDITVSHACSICNKEIGNDNIGVEESESKKIASNWIKSKKKRKCTVIDVSKPNTANYECVVTKTAPPYTVCIYDIRQDNVVSLYLKQKGGWEVGYLPTFTAMLNKFPGIGFIDIGANLAPYGLLAATMGHKTVVVEPWPDHIDHIHKSVKVGKIEDRVTVVQNAISDQYSNFTAYFAYGKQNQGALRMAPYKGQGPLMQSVLMDDLLEVIDFTVAILKIDAEGYEDKAFHNSTVFFEKIFVPYIMMEWAFPLLVYKNDVPRVEGLLSIMKGKGYNPFAYGMKPPYNMTPLDLKMWRSWPLDLIWRHKLLDPI